MILTMACKIVFPANSRRQQIVLHRCTSIEFESSWKETTSRGHITLPRKTKFFDSNKINDLFRRGDEVQIFFGYNKKELDEEFTGYISKVSADIPTRIEFEDEMFRVRVLPVNFSAKSVTLQQLLKAIIPGYTIDAQEGVNLGSVRLSKKTVGAVLDKLQQDWGMYTYMRGKTVVCGKYYSANSDEKTVNFHLERTCVSTSLSYQKKEDVSIMLKYSSADSKGNKIEVQFGDKDFNTEVNATFNYIKLEADLLNLAKMDYEAAKVDRFNGSFTAFGWPSVRPGLKCALKSTLYPDRSGVYEIERVLKKFGESGIRQEITLGKKV